MIMLNEIKLIEIISNALNVKKNKVTMKLKKESIEEWDSLGHLSILSAIDKTTKGKASKINNLSNFKTVKELYDKLKKGKLAK